MQSVRVRARALSQQLENSRQSNRCKIKTKQKFFLVFRFDELFFDALKMDEDLFAAFETEDTSSVLKKEKRGDTENTENTE